MSEKAPVSKSFEGLTLSIVLAGSDDVLSTRDRAFTEVSPVFPGSTAAYEAW